MQQIVYKTRHFPAELPTSAGGSFVRAALTHYARRAVKLKARAIFTPSIERWRDAGVVGAAYDTERAYMLERVGDLPLDEVVYGSADRFDEAPLDDFILLDDAVIWGPTRDSRRFLVEQMERRIRTLVAPGGTVLEMGCGNGRNLLYLKQRLPDRRFYGLELSPVSVRLGQILTARHGLDVEVLQADACAPLPASVPSRVDLVFSAHALEMMPRIFVKAIDNILTIAGSNVLFFEPVPELWPFSARGVASHLRAYVMDRLRGFMPALEAAIKGGGWRVVEAARLKTATNPINETALVHVARH
jgi:SAM-dependent methyltransferase